MYEIIHKERLAPKIEKFIVKAPRIAAKAQPGHFVVVRAVETGERVPLTIADFDRTAGTITLVVQAIGKSTLLINSLSEGEAFLDVLGPLGRPIPIKKVGTVVCVAGGLGAAPVLPKAKALHEAGNRVITLLGAQTRDLLILKDELAACSDEFRVATDDGSEGHKGFVTELLSELLEEGESIDEVIVVGPVPLMRAACEITRPYRITTLVSLNTIMVDGTGMCGGCRVTVDGEVKFTCVDGPTFDGHKVDFDEIMNRHRHYRQFEQQALESWHEQRKGGHECRIGLGR